MPYANTFNVARDASYEDFPSTLVVMSYDEAILALKEAMAAIEYGDIEGRFNATTRAANVMEHLHMALDMENGGQIATNLDRLYAYIITQLPVLNLRNDASIAQALIDLLMPLRDAWAELDEQVRHDVAEAESEAMLVAAVRPTTAARHVEQAL